MSHFRPTSVPGSSHFSTIANPLQQNTLLTLVPLVPLYLRNIHTQEKESVRGVTHICSNRYSPQIRKKWDKWDKVGQTPERVPT